MLSGDEDGAIEPVANVFETLEMQETDQNTTGKAGWIVFESIDTSIESKGRSRSVDMLQEALTCRWNALWKHGRNEITRRIGSHSVADLKLFHQLEEFVMKFCGILLPDMTQNVVSKNAVLHPRVLKRHNARHHV